jgi:6,7-dimethyl-8-ribityllumazine synthase
MPVTHEGKLTAEGLRFGIAASRFNELVSKRLVEGALDCLRRHGGDEKNVEIALVPGSLELPLVAQKMAQSGKFDAVICLGAVIRGGTPHFEYVASQSARGILQASLSTGVPVINGVLTADTIEQALERAGTKLGNRGFQAAESAIEMANLMKEIEAKPQAPARRAQGPKK